MNALDDIDLWLMVWCNSKLLRYPMDHGVWYNQYDFVVDGEPATIKIHQIAYSGTMKTSDTRTDRLEFHWENVLYLTLYHGTDNAQHMSKRIADGCDKDWLDHALVILRLTLEPNENI